MKRLVTVLTLLVLFGLSVNAQNVLEISGSVVDENKLPLTGATVVNKALNSACMVDESGSFKLKVKSGTEIDISFLGYIPVKMKVVSSAPINVQLKPDKELHTLSEATVVGYSKQERRDITGSVASVKLNEDKSFISVDQLLMGKATGVYVSSSSGSLGAANLLTIRGISSIMGDNNPLYVVDGVPIYGTDRTKNTLSTHGGQVPAVDMTSTQIGGGSLIYNYDLNYSYEQNPLMFLNPDDIESIEILKDAFATSIYGSRGSAGVILITTKSGRRDKLNANVTYTLSIDNPLGKLNVLTGDEYSQLYKLYYPSYRFDAGVNTDWQKEVTRTAYSHSVSANISGGTDKTTYYISLAGSYNQSYIINNDLSRYSLRTNLNTKLNDKWTLGTNTSISSVDNSSINANTIYGLSVMAAPNLPVYDSSGNYYYGYQPNTLGYSEAYNPVAFAQRNSASSNNVSVVSNVFIQYEPFDWLRLKSEVGENVSYTRTSTRRPSLPDNVRGISSDNASEATAMNNRMVINNTAELNKVAGNHFIQGVLGQSYEFATEYGNLIYGSGFFSDDLKGVGTAENVRVSAGSGVDNWALFSAFARLNYQYKQRYMAGVSYRLDGSSRYNKSHRYINIPSVSLGWRLSEEPFIKNNLKWVDDWKLRGSIGWSSKDANNTYYGAQATYSLATYNYGDNHYLTMSQPGNVNLSWEKTVTYDAGMDLSILNERLKFTLDYYYKLTTDMLFSSDLPAYTGYSKQSQNIADMQNQGIELQVYSYNIVRKNFSWMTILNVSRNTNKILKLNFEGNQLDQANSTYKYYAVGYPVAQWYLHQWEGVDPSTGDPLWRLSDGTLTTTPPASMTGGSSLNKKICGTAQPDFYGSLSNSFVFGNFEVSAMLSFAVGGRMINSTRAMLLTYSTSKAYNLSKEIYNFWQIDGQETDIPKLKNKSIINNVDYTTSITTTRFLEDCSYLRLKTLQVTYKLPEKMMSRIGIKTSVKLFASGNNLFTLTPYSGLDPEVSAFGSSVIAAGYDNLTMPQSRTFQLGIKIGL